MRWAATISGARQLDRAVAEATEEASFRLEGQRPDLAVVFVSNHHAGRYADVPRMIGGTLAPRLIIGCSAEGVIGDGREVEQRPGLSLTAAVLPGVTMSAFHLPVERSRSAGSGESWSARLVGVNAQPCEGVLLLADPFTCEVEPTLALLDEVFPAVPKVGGLASGGRRAGETVLFAGEQHHREGLVGLTMSGEIRLDTIVSQGCLPIGDPMLVTKSRKNVIFELDGQPPADVLRRLYGELSDGERASFRQALVVGLAVAQDSLAYRPGHFLIRDIVGVSTDGKALVLAARARERQVVQFHLRDAGAAERDLEAMLRRQAERSRGSAPEGALQYSCQGRGIRLFGAPDHDTDAFRRHFGAVPFGGFFCSGEIGPAEGRTCLYGYTSAFALFSEA